MSQAGRDPETGEVESALGELADPNKVDSMLRYFQVRPGGYGEGDRFIGVSVPNVRAVARRFKTLELSTIEALLESPFHECRACALIVMVAQFRRANAGPREELIALYLRKLERVDNWDLVDVSAPGLLGAYVEHGDRSLLDTLAQRDHLWSQRAAIVATQWLIKRGQFDDTFRLAEALLDHRHDLIHKASGWMLREVGERDRAAMEQFLGRHYRRMPRTMLRYAIEKLSSDRRRAYLDGTI